jgi:hypothetical protein
MLTAREGWYAMALTPTDKLAIQAGWRRRVLNVNIVSFRIHRRRYANER